MQAKPEEGKSNVEEEKKEESPLTAEQEEAKVEQQSAASLAEESKVDIKEMNFTEILTKEENILNLMKESFFNVRSAPDSESDE